MSAQMVREREKDGRGRERSVANSTEPQRSQRIERGGENVPSTQESEEDVTDATERTEEIISVKCQMCVQWYRRRLEEKDRTGVLSQDEAHSPN